MECLQPKNYSFIEVCAGAGGLSTGLMKSGFSPVLLNDNNKDCCETLRKNKADTCIMHCSMEDLKVDQYINNLDLLIGGVPCQSFSQAGLRKGVDDPRGLIMIKFIDMICKLQPKIFVIENVKGLMTHKKGETLKAIIDSINQKAKNLYTVQAKLLNSWDYGVPQKRERVFIVGLLNKYNLQFSFPEPITPKLLLKDVLYNVPESKGAQYSEQKKVLFKKIPQGGCWIHLSEDEQKTYLGKSYYSGGGKRGILYRLSMDKPSLTLLCSPSQKQTERCHPLEDRPLTIREYARIQTFDDDYIFTGSIASQYKQIGNAVPVELAKHLGIALKNTLDNLHLTKTQ